MYRNDRLRLAIILATAVLALNALAVAQGWSLFPLPDSSMRPTTQASPMSDPVTPTASRSDHESVLHAPRRASNIS